MLSEEYDRGAVLDAVVAQNEAQRQEMWDLRESAAEVIITRRPITAHDIAVPLDRLNTFVTEMERRLQRINPGGKSINLAHLRDGNIHYTVWPASEDLAVHSNIVEEVEELVLSLGGSFSAEHGIGLRKLRSMKRH